MIWRSGVTILAEIGGSENLFCNFWVLEAKSMGKSRGKWPHDLGESRGGFSFLWESKLKA